MMRTKIWLSLAAVLLLMLSCNLPAGNVPAAGESPQSSEVDAVGTSVELTTVARMTEAAGSAVPPLEADSTTAPLDTPTETPSPTPCIPSVTATTNANVRSGPDTAYGVVGSLSFGAAAEVAGRNDNNSWWYIKYAGASGGYAWIAGSVVTTSCLPSVVQVVAAPPLPPTVTPTNTKPPEVSDMPDLVASGMQYWPSPAQNAQPIDIQVKVTNSGTASAGSFTVVWLSNQSLPGCDWSISGLGAGESETLNCQFTYSGNATASYWTTLIVDSASQIAESNEGNNSRDVTLKVAP
jgi:hypothetical protein